MKKNTVDKLQLNLENLMYKQSYLRKEIRNCQDLATPNLTEIEKEQGCQLGTTIHTNLLNEVHEQTIAALNAEKDARIAAQKSLVDLEEQCRAALERLDKKRKFVDDLPAKLKLIKTATADLEIQFGQVQDEGSDGKV